MIIVNCKAYKEATGARAVALAKECAVAAKEYGEDIRIAVQAADIWRVAQAVGIPVYAQHIDPADPSRNTGWCTAHAAKAAGARGVLLNHSEHRLSPDAIAKAATLAAKEGLEVIVFVEDAAELRALAKRVTPALFCVEPAALVAGDVSVSTAKPDLVKEAVAATRIPVLVGAGVKTHEDVLIADELGAQGSILSSGIVLAKHRGQAFKKLLSPRGR